MLQLKENRKPRKQEFKFPWGLLLRNKIKIKLSDIKTEANTSFITQFKEGSFRLEYKYL